MMWRSLRTFVLFPLLAGMQNGVATLENIPAVPPEVKHKVTI